jgi:hypothetical protein
VLDTELVPAKLERDWGGDEKALHAIGDESYGWFHTLRGLAFMLGLTVADTMAGLECLKIKPISPQLRREVIKILPSPPTDDLYGSESLAAMRDRWADRVRPVVYPPMLAAHWSQRKRSARSRFVKPSTIHRP